MPDKTARDILDGIREGLEEAALLTVLGYDPSQGRPGRQVLNNALERRGYGRPISEDGDDPHHLIRSYPDWWIEAIAEAVCGRRKAPIHDVIMMLKTAPEPADRGHRRHLAS